MSKKYFLNIICFLEHFYQKNLHTKLEVFFFIPLFKSFINKGLRITENWPLKIKLKINLCTVWGKCRKLKNDISFQTQFFFNCKQQKKIKIKMRQITATNDKSLHTLPENSGQVSLDRFFRFSFDRSGIFSKIGRIECKCRDVHTEQKTTSATASKHILHCLWSSSSLFRSSRDKEDSITKVCLIISNHTLKICEIKDNIKRDCKFLYEFFFRKKEVRK